MKRITYIAAAAIAIAACQKENVTVDPVAEKAEGVSLDITGSIIKTKAVFDGDSHIAWEEGDQLKVALAASPSAETAIVPHTNSLWSTPSNTVFMNATVVSTADATFKVSYKTIPEEYVNNGIYMVGVYPYSVFKPSSTESALTGVVIELPKDQKPTATSWDPKADIMVAAPTKLEFESSDYDADYKDYKISAAAQAMTFAHAFGFAKINFAGVPDEINNSIVKNIVIEDVNNTKSFAGRFKIDLNKDITKNAPVMGDSYYASSTITLSSDKETLFKDFNVMFVVNPGTYDVKITVNTVGGTFVATRNGLKIERASIANPTVNYNTSKDEVSLVPSVDITDLEWAQDFSNYYKIIKSSTNNYTSTSRPFWGSEEKKMYFMVKYPGSTKELYPSDEGYSPYVQKFNNAYVDGGEIDLVSDAPFKGVKQVKIVTGILDADVNGTVALYMGSNLIDSFDIIGQEGRYDGTNGNTCVFNVPDAYSEGVLKLVWNNFNADGESTGDAYFKVYIASITINSAPAINLGSEAISVPAIGATGEINCEVMGAEAAPVVTCDQDWIEASFSNNKLSYTVKENTGDKRVGTVTISAKSLGTTVKTVTFTQKSANEKEYTIKITPADVNDALEAAKAAYSGTVTAESTKLTYTVDFNGVAEDGTVDSESVTIKFGEVYYDTDYIYVSEQYYSGSGKFAVSNITPLSGYVSYMGCVASEYLIAGNGIKPYVSANGNNGKGYNSSYYTVLNGATYENTSDPDGFYTSSVSSTDESMNYFLFLTFKTKTKFKELEIRYIK